MVCVGAGDTEENVRADGKHGGADLRWVLVKVLIRAGDADAEFASFGEKNVEAAVVGDEILHFVTEQREETALGARKESVLDLGEKQASNNALLRAEPAFIQVQYNPI